MNPEEYQLLVRRGHVVSLLDEVYEEVGEWIEMSDDPNAFVIDFLANRVLKLREEIKCLNKRIKDASHTSTRTN